MYVFKVLLRSFLSNLRMWKGIMQRRDCKPCCHRTSWASTALCRKSTQHNLAKLKGLQSERQDLILIFCLYVILILPTCWYRLYYSWSSNVKKIAHISTLTCHNKNQGCIIYSFIFTNHQVIFRAVCWICSLTQESTLQTRNVSDISE